jgi:hypothetical protein
LSTSADILRLLREEECPTCKQKFENIEDHVSKNHALGLDIGFVKLVMRIDTDLEKIKNIEKERGSTI